MKFCYQEMKIWRPSAQSSKRFLLGGNPATKELVEATDTFANDRLLGQGGFGRVYKGDLTNATHVAVKKIIPESKQGVEYASEVKTISQLRHKNLVQLIGRFHETKEFLLVYEFMSQCSLDIHLFEGKTLLSWETRYKIAQGIAWALQYLHEEWEQCVIHRDINAKLGDFGLARLADHAKGERTTVPAGIMGYLVPNCYQSHKASKESDIYSFGVVLLEIVCGIKVVRSRQTPDEWVWEHYGTGSLLEALDPRLGQDFDEKQVQCSAIVGLWCAHPDYRT